ncbi:MAG: methylenetetrahydrofolate reductase C-terminal domain-containing protein [Proteobacteria bacterium]|nr:methylenetetrahydrofolate reductase C-terminal domain-containing protein [Pseudomonadota bacterium]
MIVGKQKPLEEIWDMVCSHKNLLVFGCNTCVAVCHEGGNKEAESLASLLRMKAQQLGVDMTITHSGIERQCEHEFFESVHDQIENADAVLSTACGIGVQFIAEKFDKTIVYPGLNTTFLGAVESLGTMTEKCQACGNCVLGVTAGICPIARCAKRVLNGPCGGSTKGSCEINKELDCAWQLIINRLEALGQMDSYETLAPIKDWSSDRAGGPRKQIREDLQV